MPYCQSSGWRTWAIRWSGIAIRCAQPVQRRDRRHAALHGARAHRAIGKILVRVEGRERGVEALLDLLFIIQKMHGLHAATRLAAEHAARTIDVSDVDGVTLAAAALLQHV